MSSYIYDWQGSLAEEIQQEKVLEYIRRISQINHRIFSRDLSSHQAEANFSGEVEGKLLVAKSLLLDFPAQVSEKNSPNLDFDFSFLEIALRDKMEPDSALERRSLRFQADIQKKNIEVNKLSINGVRFRFPCTPGDELNSYEDLPWAEYLFLNKVTQNGEVLEITQGQMVNIYNKNECLLSDKFHDFDLVVLPHAYLHLRYLTPLPVIWLNHFIKCFYIPNMVSIESYFPFDIEAINHLLKLGESKSFQLVLNKFVDHWVDCAKGFFDSIRSESEYLNSMNISSKEEINAHSIMDFIVMIQSQ